MRVLLDTNIVLDYLGANQGFSDDAEKVFDLAAKRKDIKLVSSSAIPCYQPQEIIALFADKP